MTSAYKINGFVKEGFESVKRTFEENYKNGMERGAQLCVYVGDENVVDLWGGTDKEPPHYDGDSLVTIMSTAKNFGVLAIASLVEKNLLRYSDRVVDHWPEFSRGDKRKSSLTITQIMKHECGIPYLHKSLKVADLQHDSVKQNLIGCVIENEMLNFPPPEANTTREYHKTRPLILNEIFRRVDPKGRNIGEFMIDEICKPLNADGYYGISEEQNSRFVPASAGGLFVSDSFKRGADEQKYKLDTMEDRRERVPELEGEDLSPVGEVHLSSRDDMKTTVYSGYASARGLGRMAAMMANKGRFNGVQIFSEETWNSIHGDYDLKVLFPYGCDTVLSQGGVCRYNDRLREGWIGWQGMGGSVFHWYPKYKIGFGYVPSLLLLEDYPCAKASLLQKQILDCVEIMNKKLAI